MLRGKYFIKNMSLSNMCYHWKDELRNKHDKDEKRKKCHNLKKEHFEKKVPKVKKKITLQKVPTFNNFALIIETSGAERVTKHILENRNIHVLVSSFLDKILR